MKRFVFSIAAVMALGGGAWAEQRHALHGLFCNTEEQMEQTLTYLRRDLPPRFAVEMMNGREVACVYADRIQYVVTGPAIIGQTRLHSAVLVKYEATLVGVLVGGNLRRVEPPVRIFFVSGEHLPGAMPVKGA